MDKRGGRGGREYQDFPSKICLTVPKNFVGEPFCAVFQKVYGSEKVYGFERGEEVSRFSFESFLSDGAEKFRRRTLLCCFRSFPLRKIVMDKRGEYQGFPSKFFCLTVPKNSVGEPFCAVFQKISGSEKVYG